MKWKDTENLLFLLNKHKKNIEENWRMHLASKKEKKKKNKKMGNINNKQKNINKKNESL